jgi:hypothetical protein
MAKTSTPLYATPGAKKVAVFLSEDNHRKLKAQAASEGKSMLQFMADLVAAALKKGGK